MLLPCVPCFVAIIGAPVLTTLVLVLTLYWCCSTPVVRARLSNMLTLLPCCAGCLNAPLLTCLVLHIRSHLASLFWWLPPSGVLNCPSGSFAVSTWLFIFILLAPTRGSGFCPWWCFVGCVYCLCAALADSFFLPWRQTFLDPLP